MNVTKEMVIFMINKEKYPILEYDNNPVSKLDPMQKIRKNKNTNNISLPDYCVIAFFKSVIGEKKNKVNLPKLHILLPKL